MELNIPSDMPPVFLVNCLDDPTVDYHNSVVMDNALTNSGIPHKYIQFPTGGHGFGTSSPKADWFPLFWIGLKTCRAKANGSSLETAWRLPFQT